MRRLAQAILAAAIATWGGGSSPELATAAVPFTDIATSPFHADVSWAYDNGITGGCTATRFCPRGTVTRDQMASFLARAFKLPATRIDFFSDDEGNIHEGAVNRVAAAGITGGCATGRYCPRAVVTREQMASFIARAADLTAGAGTDYFADDHASVHETDIDRVAAAGISAGCAAARFCPSAAVTREQMVAFLHRIVRPINPPSAGGSVLVGAGDISDCVVTADEATAKLLDQIPGTVFTVGDNAYQKGTAAEFDQCYDPTWGRHRARTRPAPGNHEYGTPGATGYFGYFGSQAGPSGLGYYAYQIGAWRIYSLNSQIVSAGQLSWLESDLASHPTDCVLAYFHHPRFSSGTHGNDLRVAPFWDLLYGAGAELVLVGHDHYYERFAPQTPAGAASSTGILEVIVGTGGRTIRGFSAVQPNSVVQNTTDHGVLKLTLRNDGYTGEFIHVDGDTFTDTFSGACH